VALNSLSCADVPLRNYSLTPVSQQKMHLVKPIMFPHSKLGPFLKFGVCKSDLILECTAMACSSAFCPSLIFPHPRTIIVAPHPRSRCTRSSRSWTIGSAERVPQRLLVPSSAYTSQNLEGLDASLIDSVTNEPPVVGSQGMLQE